MMSNSIRNQGINLVRHALFREQKLIELLSVVGEQHVPNSKTVLSDHPEPNKGQAKHVNLKILGEARKEKRWRERGRRKKWGGSGGT